MKSTRRSLLASALALVACLALLMGATFAWFTDSVSNTGNKIQAGKLDVSLETWDTEEEKYIPVTEEPVFSYDQWEPGYTELVAVKVTNNGSLALKYQLDIIAAGDDTGLARVIDVYYADDLNLNEPGSSMPGSLGDMQLVGTLSDLIGANVQQGAANGHLEAGASDYAVIALHMQETAGNEYQAHSVGTSFDIQLNATQYTFETDGFGSNQYDAEAEEALKSGVTISGIAGLEGQFFRTVQEAYEAGKAVVEQGGLGQETLSDVQFDAIYTDGGTITWTIYGTQTLEDGGHILTFGRESNRYSSTRSVGEINIVGGNETAQLRVQNMGLPYAWWNDQEDALTVNIKQLTLEATGADGRITCSRAYGSPLDVYFDQCSINGYIYHYFNANGTISVTNCDFTNDGTISYAFFVQGSETEPLEVVFSNNTVTGYTRGINIQQKTAEVEISNNTIVSTNSEPDRGAIQLTDAASCLVEGNTVHVNAGNAIWFHSAAANEAVEYTIRDNSITAPYLINDDTTFGIQQHITSSGNILNITYPGYCMEKDSSEATPCDITLN